ncbi:hypothetical protein ABZY32_16465 [Nocardiopsis alba]
MFTPEELQELEAEAIRRRGDQHATSRQFAEALRTNTDPTDQEETE